MSNGYAALSDFEARFPNRDLTQLSNEDPTAQNVSNSLQVFLDDAAAEIDSYLEARFALPFTNSPSVLTRVCCEIAMFHAQPLRPIHDLALAKEIYDKNLAFLTAVANGERTLGLNSTTEQEPADPSTPAVVFVQAGGIPPSEGIIPARVFSRGKMIGF